ncbi:MAG: TolC family protein [Desulfovibrionaceae bacterium]|nr:TolC family protein [Desulfovibrionaceae bacterium]
MINFMHTFSRIALGAVILLMSSPLGLHANTLQNSVASALRYNPTIKQYREGVEIAERNLMKARSGWYPTLDISARAGVLQYADPSTRSKNKLPRSERNYTKGTGLYFSNAADAVLRYNFFNGLATMGSTDVASFMIKSADFRLIDNTEAIALDAILAHLNVVRYSQIVLLSRQNVAQHEKILLSQSQRRRLGAGSVADVSQTQSRLARAKATLADNVNRYRDALATYTAITGVQVSGNSLANIQPLAATFSSYESALAATRSSNPKINALLMDVKATEKQAVVSRSRFMPEIYADLAYTYAYQPSTIADNDMHSASLMLRLDWNLFNGMADYASMKSDLARARQIRYEVLSLIDTLAEETKMTWNRYVSAVEQKTFYASAKRFALESRNAYLQQFQVGQRSLLDVLDAENELFSTSVLEVTAHADTVATQYRILALGGKLLSYLGINPQNLKKTPLEQR